MGSGLTLAGNKENVCRQTGSLSLHFKVNIDNDVLRWNFDVDIGRHVSEAFGTTCSLTGS
jgi:hypothetical protein